MLWGKILYRLIYQNFSGENQSLINICNSEISESEIIFERYIEKGGRRRNCRYRIIIILWTRKQTEMAELLVLRPPES